METNNKVKIVTDHKWKYFKYGYDVPKRTMVNDFDYLDELEQYDNFIWYRKRWYHLSNFMDIHNKIHCPNPPNFMKGYDGYLSDSAFSGVLIKVYNGGEMYQIATYIL